MFTLRRVLLAAALAAPLCARAEDAWVRVTAESTTLREGPAPHHPELASLRRGDVLALLDRDPFGRWWQVRTDDGREGWMSALDGRRAGGGASRLLAGRRSGTQATLFGGAARTGAWDGAAALRLGVPITGRLSLEAELGGAAPAGARVVSAGALATAWFTDGELAPYLLVGAALLDLAPSSAASLREPDRRTAVLAGGGLQLQLASPLTLRVEGRYRDAGPFSGPELLLGLGVLR